MIGERIKEACNMTGISLKKACTLSEVKYGTLYNQISFGREIPFETVVRMSDSLHIPLSFFAASSTLSSPSTVNANRWKVAEIANSERGACSRAGFSVSTDDVLDWYHKEGGILKNWEWFSDQVDLYHPIEPTDKIMRPVQIGKRSLTAERLMITGNRDFYQIVGSFEKKILDRAMSTHRSLQDAPYLVTDEEIDVRIKGQRINSGYRKVSMSLIGSKGEPITAVFSKLTWINGM